jgi:hypothetical protein
VRHAVQQPGARGIWKGQANDLAVVGWSSGHERGNAYAAAAAALIDIANTLRIQNGRD